jgi:hypothetical protein
MNTSIYKLVKTMIFNEKMSTNVNNFFESLTNSTNPQYIQTPNQTPPVVHTPDPPASSTYFSSPSGPGTMFSSPYSVSSWMADRKP